MMTTDEEKILDQAFAQVRADVPAPSEGVMDRIMFDADRVLAQIAPGAESEASFPVKTQGLGAAVLDAIGGWMSFGGLSAAAMTGLWIGVFPPDVLYDFSADTWGDTIEVPLLENDIFSGFEG